MSYILSAVLLIFGYALLSLHFLTNILFETFAFKKLPDHKKNLLPWNRNIAYPRGGVALAVFVYILRAVSGGQGPSDCTQCSTVFEDFRRQRKLSSVECKKLSIRIKNVSLSITTLKETKLKK